MSISEVFSHFPTKNTPNQPFPQVFSRAGNRSRLGGEKAAAFAYHAGALHPHTSILLRDFHPWQDMNTDGTRLRETYGLPGIGMYMMEDRCPYHTIYDDLSHIVSGNLQAHGDNFLGVSQAVTRNQEILDLWAKDDSDPSGSAYTIDLLSSSMLLLTPTTMAVLYSILGIAIIFIIGFTTYQADPSARVAVGVNLTFLSLHHFASIVTGLLVSFAIAACVGSNFGYWYRRDGMAVWLYAFPCLCVQLLFGRILLSQRYSKIPDEELQCQSSIATLIVLVLLTLLLALTGLHLSLLFGMCALTRLAGFLLRRICLLKRWMKIKAIKQHETQLAWLGVIAELVLASLGAIYLLDAMRFAVLNFTTSFGEEGQVLPGELTLGLYVGLFLSLAILQSGAVQVPNLCQRSEQTEHSANKNTLKKGGTTDPKKRPSWNRSPLLKLSQAFHFCEGMRIAMRLIVP